MNKSLVSIIVRTKDRPKLLCNALQSIAAQTYRPIEVIVVNDGGCELPATALRGILGTVMLRYVSLRDNVGRAAAVNVGIANAQGDFIGFLDDDDELYPEHVSLLMSALNAASDSAGAYSDTEIIERRYDPEGNILSEEVKGPFKSWEFSREVLLFENYIPLMCSILKKSVIREIGGVDESFEMFEDWDLFIRASRNMDLHHVGTVTTRYIQWSKTEQIAFVNWPTARDNYLKVLSKHADQFTPGAVYRYFLFKQEDAARLAATLRREEDLCRALTSKAGELGGILQEEREQNRMLRDRVDYLESRNREMERLIRELSLKNVDIEIELSKMQEMRADLDEKNLRIAELENEVTGQRTMIQENTLKLSEEQEQVRLLREDIFSKSAYIEEVHSSFGWILLEGYRKKIRSRFLPPGTNRHRAYTKGLKLLKTADGEGLKTLPGKMRKFFREMHAISGIRKEVFVVPRISETGISSMKVPVSVVIPTRNAGPDFVHVLNTIKRQKGIKPAEVIIVDSSSEDDTLRIAGNYGARVFSIDPADFGHGRTRNFGAGQASGDYIIFLSQDAIPAGDFCFRDMILGMQEDQALAAVTARQIPRSDADLYACWEMWNHYEKFMQFSGDRVLSVSKGSFDSLGPADKRRTAQIDNVFSCVRRSFFQETLFSDIPYAEDLDLGLRLLRKGYKLAFLSSVAAIHSHNRDAMYYFRRSCTDRRALVSLVGYEPMDWKTLGIGSLSSMAAYIRSASRRLTGIIDEFGSSLKTEGIGALSPGYFQKRMQLSRANGAGGANCRDVIRAVKELADIAGDEDRQVSVSIDVLTHQFLSIVESFAEYIRIYADSEAYHEEIISALRKQCAVVFGANLGDFAAYSEMKNMGEDLTVVDRIVGRLV